MPYSYGEVVLVLFPNSDLRTAKRRPALVVQRDDLGTGLPQTIVAMVTSSMSRAGHPSRIAVPVLSDVGQAAGLLTDSVVMTDNLAAVRDGEVDRVIGRFQAMDQVAAALQCTLAMDRQPEVKL